MLCNGYPRLTCVWLSAFLSRLARIPDLSSYNLTSPGPLGLTRYTGSGSVAEKGIVEWLVCQGKGSW